MNEKRYTFIGGGNMARSLIGGMINDGCDPEHIRVADPGSEQRQQLSAAFGIHTSASNIEALQQP
ncbi:Pyrroline-5-carboxylate reductase, partial [hydrothermal vent metagenome]